MTSHDVVARLRRVVGKGVKVGHAGTLDPAASGVLPIALGSATRLIEYLVDAKKCYHAVIALGVTTTTDDAEGEIFEERPVPPLDRETLEPILMTFCGTILQVPPMYAAIHQRGKRLYDLARAGVVVERAPRRVTIDQIELLELCAVPPQIVLSITCGKGTYIRALARDIGEALGCGGHLAHLSRTRVGPFTIDQAVTLAAVLECPACIVSHVLPPHTVVEEWEMVILDTKQIQRVKHGLPITDWMGGERGEGSRVRAHHPDGALLALLRWQPPHWWPEKVFI